MPSIEILCYSTNDIAKFVDFAVNGKRDEQGNFVKDELDRLQTGVFAWLHGREIPNARFFSTAPGDPIQLFVSVIEPTEPLPPVPWMELIPGFKAVLRTDGLIGLTSSPDFGTSAAVNMPLASVVPRPDLDKIFEEGKDEIDNLDFSEQSFTKEEFLDALKGMKDTDVQPMLTEIKATQNIEVAKERLAFRARG